MPPLTGRKPKSARSRTSANGARPIHIWQRDVTRAVKAVTKAGLNIRRVEIDREGRIAIITVEDVAAPDGDGSSELDQWMAKNAHQAKGH
jgi:hypothetical protein